MINVLTGKYMASGSMFFTENFYSFRISKESSITADVAINDTSISMVTDGMNSQGRIML
ncbi:hypothetical protein [Oenococcus oeni]|uniref:hypothetical protein n=1 Tax=Oenococcus oeni TaxID=1247 RepID=UPI0015D67125|nr:hypothetical protein [Oenococcus oeni]